MLGIGASFISGADSAFAYDTLLASGLQDRYRKFEAVSMAFSSIGGVLASLAGGLIAAWLGLRATIALQVPLDLFLLAATLLLREPVRHKIVTKSNAIRDVLRVTTYALHGHREIKWLIMYGAVVGTMTHTVLWLYPLYYQMVGIPIGWFGVLGAAQYGAVVLFSMLVNRYEKLGRGVVFTSFIVIGVATYLAMGFRPTVWLIGAQIGFHFIRAVSDPILKDYVNCLVESDIRATVLSVKSLVQRVLYIGVGPVIGWVVDAYSLRAALLFSAMLYGGLGAITLLALRRHRLLGR